MKKLLLFALILAAFGSTFAQNDTRQRFYRHLGTDTLSVGKVPGYMITRTGDSLFFTTSGGTRIKFAPLSFSGDIAASQIISGTIATARLPWTFSSVTQGYLPFLSSTGTFTNSGVSRTSIWDVAGVEGTFYVSNYQYNFAGLYGYGVIGLVNPSSADTVTINVDGSGKVYFPEGISASDATVGKYARFSIVSLTGSTVDWAVGSSFEKSLSGNVTFAFSNLPGSQMQSITVKITNTGSYTVTWPAGVKWAGGTTPTQTTGSGKTDIYSFIYYGSGSTVYGSVVQNF